VSCPRPDKTPHPSRFAAERHLRSLQRNRAAKADLHVYRCGCGAWHVGNGRAKLQRPRGR